MKRRLRVTNMALLATATFLATPPRLGAIPFSKVAIIIEVNATAGDGGIQVSLDAVGWNRLEVTDPNGQEVFEVSGSGGVGMTGVTELFFESAEPSFQDLPLDQLLDRHPAGRYTFAGMTVDGKPLTGRATLRHNIPAGPTIVSPAADASLCPTSPVVIDWDPVTSPFPGTHLPVTIAGYQVIVERVKPQPLLAFSVNLPAAVTSITVPAEFIQTDADYKFEVLAIEASGNQTITEGSFTTAVQKAAGERAQGSGAQGSNAGAVGLLRVGYLRQDHANRFNPATRLEFGLPAAGAATLRIFDARGRMVRALVNGYLPAGPHRAIWDGTDARGRPAASGVYFAALAGPGVSESRRMILMR